METVAFPAYSRLTATLPSAEIKRPVQDQPFGHILKNAIANLDDLQKQAATSIEEMVTGRGIDVHDVMIAAQKADMAFELALSIRNKIVTAYQQVMGMQF